MGKPSNSPLSKHANTIQKTELLKRKWLSKNAFEIELSRPAAFDFEPGQTLLIVHGSIARHYCLISTPADSALILCVQHIPHGTLSPILASAQIGTRFEFSGPYGYFTFKPSQRHPVFVATGTGIAPIVSMVRAGITGFTLFHEVQFEKELFYQSELREAALAYYACLAKISEDKPPSATLFCGKAADCLKKNLKRARYDFYLCGSQEMIREVTLLADENYAGSLIYTEVFFTVA